MVEWRRTQVFQLAENLLGQVAEVVHQPYGHAGMTFEVRTASGEYIVKTRDTAGAFDNTEHHIQVLTRLSIPVPHVVCKGTFDGFSYVLLRKIPGEDFGHSLGAMTRPDMTHLAEQIVEIERKVTQLPEGTGFGWTPLEVPGPFPNWTAVIARDSSLCSEDVRRNVARWTSYFDAVRPTCFLDDLTVKNVIVLAGKLQGIVDLDEVCFGDPLYWLSLAEVTVALDVGVEGSFYGKELRRLWKLTEEMCLVCDLYNAIQAESFLSRGSGGEILREWMAQRLARVSARC